MELVKSFTFGEEIGEKIAVKFSAEGIVVKATAASDEVCGVTLFGGQQGAVGDVLMFGLGSVATSDAVDAGDFLVASSDGKLEKLDTETAEGTLTVVGRVLETASAGAHLAAFINPQVLVLPTAAAESSEEEESEQ